MKPIQYYNRSSREIETEKVYGARALRLLYGDDLLSRLFGAPLLHFVCRFSFCSALYGWWQSCTYTKKKIAPFIKKFHLDDAEFEKSIDQFSSFNDFFTRRLKKEVRPIAAGDKVAIIPADGRYLVYPQIDLADGFVVKGEKFHLETLLQNHPLAEKYAQGGMVIARLCPTDYHRFFFPCDGTPRGTMLINGFLFSVNPVAIKQDLHIFTQNKRTLCEFDTEGFGKILYLEIGATSVGSIIQTYEANHPCTKGDEKGYFSFGASSLIILFEKGAITFDNDLVEASSEHIETRCLYGTSLGHKAG